MSGIEAILLFLVCKTIQVLGISLAALVTYKYEGILLVEYATMKTLKPDVLFLFFVMFGLSIPFLSIAGSMWDPAIKILN